MTGRNSPVATHLASCRNKCRRDEPPLGRQAIQDPREGTRQRGMTAQRQRAASIILMLLLILIAGVFGLSSQFCREGMVAAYFAFALASVVILHLRVRPEGSHALLILAGMVLLALLDFHVLVLQTEFGSLVFVPGVEQLSNYGGSSGLGNHRRAQDAAVRFRPRTAVCCL